MLVVLGHKYDAEVQDLVSRWEPQGARLLTPSDLSLKGWRHYSGESPASRSVVSGTVISNAEISAVLTLLPGISEQELVDIVPSDRSYVAAEMTAFLLSWLSSLQCPVINRPTPACLSGPYWRQEHWVSKAARLGIPVRPLHRRATLSGESEQQQQETQSVSVTVVGEQYFGETDATLLTYARHLANLAGVDLLTVRFNTSEGEPYFVDAQLRPDLTTAGVGDAFFARLQELAQDGRSGPNAGLGCVPTSI